MSEKMREAVQRAVQKSALRAMQDMWDDLDKAGTVPCLMGYYSDRLVELESLLSALRTHENVGQESGEGAILYMAKNLHSKSYATSRSKAEAELFLLQSGLKVDGKEAAVIPLYLAPPSAPAIEAAVIMRAVEVVNGWAESARRHGFEGDAGNYDAIADGIKALIPQDGRTALEEFGMKVAEKAVAETIRSYNEKRVHKITHAANDEYKIDFLDLRAIVTNLIGAAK